MAKRIAVIDLGTTAINVVTADAERICSRPFGWGEFEPPEGWQTSRLCASRRGSVRGSVIASRLAFVRAHGGESALAKVLGLCEHVCEWG
jgi:hypothetical protein